MTEENSAEQEDSSFVDMLARQEAEEASPRLETGQRVKATVVAVTNDAVFVSTGNKVDGIVEKAELEQDGISCALGDVLDLYVVHVSPQEVRLSKVVRGAGSLEVLEKARVAALPVEGKVLAAVRGGFSVEVMRRRAFCPASQMDLRPADDPGAHLGKIYNFLIVRMEQNGRNIVLSRRSLLESAQAENLRAFLERAREGDVLEGSVQRLTPFGAFVELAPGVEGLAHVSELSWSRLARPDELLTRGEKVRVKILELGKEAKESKEGKEGREVRISLSLRQVTEDPWNKAADLLRPGAIVQGKVARLAAFGAFVEVLPGIEGLVHLSEMSWEKRSPKIEDILACGDTVSVKVKEVDPEKRRVSLSLREAAGDPWAGAEEDFPLDSEQSGRLEKRADFGLFIALAPGVTGLMPNSLLAGTSGKSKFDRLSVGETVQVRIAELNAQTRKITLAPAGEDAEEAPRESGAGAGGKGRAARAGKGRAPAKDDGGDWKRHAGKGVLKDSFGSLGAALALAMEKKKK
ncbi:MAG: S1 RNA-binding domain-containing protein [Deltaproteobacteria bacterium]|jgi:small subunit ribosomal protein S1|nr:S1 RNA-binding domain-containing protein [Deltaproteobacteria bacterium]